MIGYCDVAELKPWEQILGVFAAIIVAPIALPIIIGVCIHNNLI